MSTSFFGWMALASLMVGLAWPLAKSNSAGSDARIATSTAQDTASGTDSSGSGDSGSGDSSDDSDDSD
jgi:hypothetical protein